MARLSLSLIIFSVTLTASPVHLLVPPKTPVLSGFETAAIGFYRELVCDASQPNAGTITYKWYKYSPIDSHGNSWESKGPIGTSQKYIFNPVSEKQVYHQGGAAEHVSGKYKCRASNSAGTRDSDWGHLYVYTPCALYSVRIVPVSGSAFILNCFIPFPSGFAVMWTKQHYDIPSTPIDVAIANSSGCQAPTNTRYSWSSCSPPSLSSKTNTFNLQVTNARTSDSAYWTCKDINLSCISNPLQITVGGSAKALNMVEKPNTPILAGTSFNIKCATDSSTSGSPGTIYWYWNAQHRITTGVTPSTRSATFGGTIYISQLTVKARKEDNQAKYECKINDQANYKKDVTITVYYPPTVTVSSNSKPVKEEENLSLTCETSGGNPTSYNYSWYYNNLKQRETSKEYNITGIKYTQSGKYKCEAINYSPGGKADAMIEIDVFYKAKWNPALPALFTVVSKTNEPVTFVLHVIAIPPPTNVTWSYQNNTAIGKGLTARKVNDTTYTLKKTSVTSKDYGNYKVNVTNQVGVSTFVFELQKASAPYPPCCLKMVKTTAVSILMTFKSIFSGGSQQTFTIEQRSSTGGNVWVIAAVQIADPGIEKDVLQKILGLTGGITYEFRVKAVNADGSSGYGNILTAKTPAAPRTVLEVNRDGKLVRATWTPLGRRYTKIDIRYCTIKGGVCTIFAVKDPAGVEARLPLNDGESYEFYLRVYDGDNIVFISYPVWLVRMPAVGIDGIIAGVVVSVVVLVAMMVVVVVIMKRRKKACFSGEDKHTTVTFDNTSGDGRVVAGSKSGPVYMNVDNKGFRINDPSEGEPEYDELHHEQRVPVIVYEDVRPKPSAQTAPKKMDDITVAEFKQWLLSKQVTESTYKVLAKNGLNKAGIFALLHQRDEDIKRLHIKPLGQEIVVRNLAKCFNMLNQGNGREEASTSSRDGGARDDMENPYAELNITPDVIADQVYTELRPSKK